MQVKPKSCVCSELSVSGFSLNGNVLGGGGKVNTTESLSQTVCGLCKFRESNPVATNMLSARTPGISNFHTSTSDFIYLY